MSLIFCSLNSETLNNKMIKIVTIMKIKNTQLQSLIVLNLKYQTVII